MPGGCLLVLEVCDFYQPSLGACMLHCILFIFDRWYEAGSRSRAAPKPPKSPIHTFAPWVCKTWVYKPIHWTEIELTIESLEVEIQHVDTGGKCCSWGKALAGLFLPASGLTERQVNLEDAATTTTGSHCLVVLASVATALCGFAKL